MNLVLVFNPRTEDRLFCIEQNKAALDRTILCAAAEDGLARIHVRTVQAVDIFTFFLVRFTTYCKQIVQIVMRCLYCTPSASLSHAAIREQMHTARRLKLTICITPMFAGTRFPARAASSAVRHRTFLRGLVRSSTMSYRRVLALTCTPIKINTATPKYSMPLHLVRYILLSCVKEVRLVDAIVRSGDVGLRRLELSCLDLGGTCQAFTITSWGSVAWPYGHILEVFGTSDMVSVLFKMSGCRSGRAKKCGFAASPFSGEVFPRGGRAQLFLVFCLYI